VVIENLGGPLRTAPHADGPSDPASIRRSNLGLILRHLRDQGPRSRARLAAETGLSKATTSALVGDLVERGLAVEGSLEREGLVGRPGMAVELHGRSVGGLGIEINVDYLSATAVDLRGDVVAEATRPIDAATGPAEVVLDAVGELAGAVLSELGSKSVWPAGIAVAAPGMIDHPSGTVRYAPNIGWRDVHLVDELSARLGPGAPSVTVENDAKLGAVAEYAEVSRSGVRDLLYITGDVGVGGGIISGGRLLRGSNGFAGEIGHMPLDPGMRPCACGRRGCWETMVGLAAFLREVAPIDDPVHDPSRDLEERLGELIARHDDGDERVVDGVAVIAAALGTGISILVDVLNPRHVVLGGYFAYLGDRLIEPVSDSLRERLIDPEVELPIVSASSLGLTAAARGGAHLALERVFADPTVVEV